MKNRFSVRARMILCCAMYLTCRMSAVLSRQCILEWCAIRPAIRRIGMQLETCWWSLYEPTWLQSSSFRRPVPLSGIPEWTFNNSLAAKCKRSVRRRERVNGASAWKKLDLKRHTRERNPRPDCPMRWVIRAGTEDINLSVLCI